RQLARMRGIDFDTFISTYFSGDKSLESTQAPITLPVVTELRLDSIPKVSASATLASTEVSSSTYFGYEIFQQNPFREKEYLVGNIDEGYVIAPGDVLRIIVFGNNSLEFEATVDLNGNINIPKYGVFQASGNRFKTLKQRLTTYLGKYFSGLLKQPQNTFIDVSLTQIRPVKVSVLGQVNAPGPHLVNGLASVLNALYTAGGVKESGSLREVYVYRNSRKIRTIDVYDYITTGRIKNDLRLTSNDVIFVPNRLSTVALAGTVKKETFYELKASESLSDLVEFSGGLLPNVDTQKVNVERITPFEDRPATQVYNRFLTTVDYSKIQSTKEEFSLMDGDKVTFFPILDLVERTVTVTGSIQNPGTYSVTSFSNLRDLILTAGKGISPNTYLNKVDIEREDKKGNKSFSTYNLQAVLDNTVSVRLQDQDVVKVYSLEEVAGQKTVRISGFGIDEEEAERILFWRENLSVFDVIFEATAFEETDFQRQVLTSRLDVKRYNSIEKQFENIALSLEDLAALKAFKLEPKDQVILYSRAVTERVNPIVAVVGFVQKADTLGLEKEMVVEDALLKAEGFLESADKNQVIINRESFDQATGQLSKRYTYTIDQDYLLGRKDAPQSPFYLEDKDIISVRKSAGYQDRKSITVNGAVVFPGTVISEFELENFASVLKQVGGLKENANLKASYILREGKSLAVDLDQLSSKNFLQDGDQIVIAENNGTVETLGGVENESLFIWSNGKRAKFYIRNSGGKVAKEGGKAYLILPNGKSKKIGFLRNPTVLPNSKIIVNRKLQKEKQEGKFLDDFTRIFGILSGTLTTILLTQRL
ncbi:MAG: SLBB domain-containing protein, partial [Flavobacteriaceae bacterium]|nr:SLBB domain-containing protein [Flavobacteriaceae bacterium]